MGTGAADWKEPKKDGEYRGFRSTLIDGEILLDCTAHTLKRLREMQVDWAQISAVFFTHSHSDHCNPEAAGRLHYKSLMAAPGPFAAVKKHK